MSLAWPQLWRYSIPGMLCLRNVGGLNHHPPFSIKISHTIESPFVHGVKRPTIFQIIISSYISWPCVAMLCHVPISSISRKKHAAFTAFAEFTALSSPPSTSADTNPPPASCRCLLHLATAATCSPRRRFEMGEPWPLGTGWPHRKESLRSWGS